MKGTFGVNSTGLPESEVPVNGVEVSEDSMEVDQQKRGIKRPGVDHESDDESSSAVPPVNDIYRSRQQKKSTLVASILSIGVKYLLHIFFIRPIQYNSFTEAWSHTPKHPFYVDQKNHPLTLITCSHRNLQL